MSMIVESGYLESLYLDDYPYLSGQVSDFLSAQVEMKVFKNDPVFSQVDMRVVNHLKNVMTQVNQKIADFADDPHVFTQVEMKVYAAREINTQVQMVTAENTPVYTQVAMRIIDVSDDPHVFTQVEMKVYSSKVIHTEVDMLLMSETDVSTQVEMIRTNFEDALNMQVKIGNLAHYICGGYLAEIPYLTDPYLTERFCAHMYTQVEMNRGVEYNVPTEVEMRIIDEADDPHVRSQVEMRVFKEKDIRSQVKMRIIDEADDRYLHTQVDQKIYEEKAIRSQVEMRIVDHLKNIRTQVNQIKSTRISTQATLVIYNTEQMRILLDFISRGTPGLGGINWVSVQAIRPGDFSPNNLNTDIVEQRTETDGITALWQLRCNTGNPNSFVDTIGILNHNFSRSAQVEVSGSDDPAFSTIKFSFTMETELENMYYIAPTLPNIPAQYYQFTIQDPGNAAGSLSIGTIVFGSSIILTRKEQFVNPVTFGKRHYKDALETEGYTSVSNDRATRRFLNLTFEQLLIDGGNFRSLRNYIDIAKTDLKALVIPRPTKASRLAVFAKMSQLPEELHNAIDDDNWRVNVTFDWDESL